MDNHAKKLIERYKKDGLNMIVSDSLNIFLRDLSSESIIMTIKRLKDNSINNNHKNDAVSLAWIEILEDAYIKLRYEKIIHLKEKIIKRKNKWN